jgi:hypothetical protein
LTPPAEGADFLAAFVANCLRGAFPPVDFLAVCFVLAMIELVRFIKKLLRLIIIKPYDFTWFQVSSGSQIIISSRAFWHFSFSVFSLSAVHLTTN